MAKQQEIKMTRMTGNNVNKQLLNNKSAIKDELKRTEEKRRMSRMAGANLSQAQINQKKSMKEELAQAAIKNKVQNTTGQKNVDNTIIA